MKNNQSIKPQENYIYILITQPTMHITEQRAFTTCVWGRDGEPLCQNDDVRYLLLDDVRDALHQVVGQRVQAHLLHTTTTRLTLNSDPDTGHQCFSPRIHQATEIWIPYGTLSVLKLAPCCIGTYAFPSRKFLFLTGDLK